MRASLSSALALIGLCALPSAAIGQDDIRVGLSPNNGGPGTVVTVDLLEGSPFSPTADYGFSFADDLASRYARTPASFTWVSPSQLTFTVPNGVDCGTHYFGVVAPVLGGGVRYRVPKGRTPFEVTDPCNHARRNAFDVLNYNVQFLPDLVCLLAHPPCAGGSLSCLATCGKDARVEPIGSHPDLQNHDVIVFEEAFSDSHRQQLRDLLRPQYAHQTTVLGRDGFASESGGVMILSKWPIERYEQHIYDKTYCEKIEECRSDKGIQYVRINKGGQRYHVFGTHTHAGDSSNDSFARRLQMAEFREFIAFCIGGAARTDPVIMAGDFNINRHEQPADYAIMLGQLTANLPDTIDRDNPGARIGTNKDGAWIDFVLYHLEFLQPSSSRNYVIKPKSGGSPYTDGDLSDHFAVLGRFVFNTLAAPPPPPPDPGDGNGGGGGGSCTVTPPTLRPTLAGPSGCFAAPTRPTFEWSSVPLARDYKLALFDTTDPADEPLLFYEAVPGTSMTLPFGLTSERRYRWKVKAQNCAGSGPFSNMMFFTLSSDCRPPEVAPVVTAPVGCVDAVRPTFTWSAVPRSTSYRIVVSPADHDDFFIDEFVTGTSLVSPVALNPQLPYRVKVRAVNDAGPGPWSEIVYFTTFCNGVMSTITSPVGCTSTQTPTFTWEAVPPAVQYWLLVGDSPDFSAPTTTRFIDVHTTGTLLATPPGVSFAANKTYYTKVKTILDPTSTTAAAWSSTVSFTPLCPANDAVVVAQSMPTSMTPGVRYTVSVTMKNSGLNIWSPPAYRLGLLSSPVWGVSSVDLPAAVAPGAEVNFNFTVTAPSTGGIYVSQWRMVQDPTDWFGQATLPVTITVIAPSPPDPPPLPIAIGPQACISTLRPTFTWNAVARADRYQIAVTRADVENFFVNDANATATSYSLGTDLVAGVQYRWKVRACNNAGCGPWSPSMYFKPLCGATSTITAPLGCIATQTPAFTWVPVSGAIDYWLMVGNSPDFSAPTTTRYVDVHVTSSSYAPGIAFSPSTTYYAKVKSTVTPGSTTGGYSPTVSFRPLCVDTSPR